MLKKKIGHNSKKKLLKTPVEHIDITSFDSRKIISSMEKMSFASRETANAAKIFNEMIKDKNCTIFLTLAGSTSAAGCMELYKDLVKYNMVDAIVATGASIIDMDFFEALGFKHYQGSQCMHPISYSKGIHEIGRVIKKTKIYPDYINVGGGFPSIYPDLRPQPLNNYMSEILKGIKNLKLEKPAKLLCEPGRALVAESGSTIVRINLRKKQKLYINDGTYGSLFDAGAPNLIYPSRLITNGRMISKKKSAFDYYGPTCDSMDYMKGPFVLPNNIKEGDYIELGQLGAYGLTFRTQFNGFYSDEIYKVEDNPIMSMYDKETNKEFLVA